MAQLRSISQQDFTFDSPVLNARAANMPKSHPSHYGKYLKPGLFALDLLVLNLSLLFGIYFKRGIIPLHSSTLYFLLAGNLLWLGLSIFFKRHEESDRNFRWTEVMGNTLKIVVVHFLVISAVVQFSLSFRLQSYLLPAYLLLVIVAPLSRLGLLFAVAQYRRLGYNYRNVIIIGTGDLGKQMYQYIKGNPALGLNFRGFFDDQPSTFMHQSLLKGSLAEMEEFCRRNNINEIFCALPITEYAKIEKIMSFADNNVIRFRYIPDLGGLLQKNVKVNFYDQIPVVTPRHEPLEQLTNRVLKRAFDIVFSVLVISLIFPILFPILAILIKLSSKGPVFFKQLRTGKDNNSFYCYKFRTMRINQDSDKKQACKNDNRITKIGAFMRKTSLDELPQFFNVLQGDMSVVGPRPHMLLHTEEYSKIIDSFMVRHFVKPGITGWAQVNGYRGNTEAPELMAKRVAYDTWYLENWSLWLDITIIFKTVFNIFQGEENAF
jgi:Undecaprenyl-phosphate glucose phosphotransferase